MTSTPEPSQLPPRPATAPDSLAPDSLAPDSLAPDPLGPLARLSAASLLAITPEYFKLRGMRAPGAARLRRAPTRLPMDTELATIDGLKIRYARSQRPGAPTLLLLSPLPQSIHCYSRLWTALRDEMDLLAVDLPGFGGSEGGMSLMSFAAQSAFLDKIVRHFGLRDVHILAPDVAMPVALHYVTHGEHAARSLLVGDGPGVLPSDDGSLVRKIVGSSFWRAMVRLNGARTFLATAIAVGYLHYSPSAAEVQDYVDAYAGRIDQVVAYSRATPRASPPSTPTSTPCPCPCRSSGAITTPSSRPRTRGGCTGALSQLTIFERCGRFSYQDRPGAFTEMLQAWVGGGHEACETRAAPTAEQPG